MKQQIKDNLLRCIKKVIKSAEYAPKQGFRNKAIEFINSCGCYSEVTQEPCSLQIFLYAKLNEYSFNGIKQFGISTKVEKKLNEIVYNWAKKNLVWNGCECCENYLQIDIRLFNKLKEKQMSKEKKISGRGSALRIPLRCSSELREVSGEKRLSRGGAIKWFWKYAEKHKLKDKKDGRIIHVEKDKELAAVMGKKPVKMTEVAGKIFKHLKKEE
jgi:hypothetical protein